MTMEEKNLLVKNYILEIKNQLNSKYPNILTDEKIEKAIQMFSNSEKEYNDIVNDINSMINPMIESYIKYIEERENLLEKLQSQIITVEKDNPYFGEVYKTYIIEVLDKFEEIQGKSDITDKKTEFENQLKILLNEKNTEMTQLLYQQISEPNRRTYGQSELFLGSESLTYETVGNLYNTFINDINIVSNDSEGKMYCTVLNNQRIFDENGNINSNIQYNFDLIEKTYNFAKKHGKQVKFHTFLWHNAVPENLKNEIDSIQDPVKKREMTLSFLRDYSSKLSAFIKEKGYDIRQIEALNEIASDNLISPEIINNLKKELLVLENESQNDTIQETIIKRNKRIIEIKEILKNDSLRSSWWRDVIGEDYYIETFKILRDCFPNVELIYNEYNEMLPCKADRIAKIIESVRSYEQSPEGKEKYPNGIFDGIGLQGHVTDFHIDKKTGGKLPITEKEILYGLGRIQQACLTAGKKVYITEADCQHILNDGQSQKNNAIYNSTASKIANGYIVWGNSDKLTWSRMFHPITKENMNGHMINSDGIPKNGWNQLKETFNHKVKYKSEQSTQELKIDSTIKPISVKRGPKVKTLTKPTNSSSGYTNVITLSLIVSFFAGILCAIIYLILNK